MSEARLHVYNWMGLGFGYGLVFVDRRFVYLSSTVHDDSTDVVAVRVNAVAAATPSSISPSISVSSCHSCFCGADVRGDVDRLLEADVVRSIRLSTVEGSSDETQETHQHNQYHVEQRYLTTDNQQRCSITVVPKLW